MQCRPKLLEVFRGISFSGRGDDKYNNLEMSRSVNSDEMYCSVHPMILIHKGKTNDYKSIARFCKNDNKT